MPPTGLSDAQVQRFKRIAWPYLPVVLRTAQYLTQNEAEAEDVAQETMVKAMRAIDTYRDGTNVKAWLMTILRRTHIDHIRAARARGVGVSLDTGGLALESSTEPGRYDDQWERPEELMDRLDDGSVIEALQGLPEAIRWTLLLVDVEQMDHADAAVVLQVPEGTVKSRAHRGRKMLRDRLFQTAVARGWVEATEAGEP